MSTHPQARGFRAEIVRTERGHVRVPLPFDPREAWGRKPRHYVTGTVNGTPFDGSVGFAGGGAFVVLNAAFRTAAAVEPGDTVDVVLEPRAE